MNRLTFLLPAVLVGCANPAYHAERAAQSTPIQLCEAYYFGPPAVHQAAYNEAQRRGLDCSTMRDQATMMYQGRLNRNASEAAAIQQLQRALNPPMQPPPTLITPSVNCTSYRAGNTVQTHCR